MGENTYEDMKETWSWGMRDSFLENVIFELWAKGWGGGQSGDQRCWREQLQAEAKHMPKILQWEDAGKFVELDGPAAPDLFLGLSWDLREPLMLPWSDHLDA